MSLTFIRKSATVALALALVASVLMAFPLASTRAATVLSDGFGTGNDDNDIDNWNEEGNDNDSSTLAKKPDANGNDIASPDGGRFAKIGQDEWICRQVDASGLYGLTLKYYWNGDTDAEGSDEGVIEYRATSNGNTDSTCNSNASSWDQLTSHDLNDDTNWSGLQTLDLPDELDNDSSWFIRFRTDSSSSDEYFRVDGVLIEGTPPDTVDPTVTINQAAGQSDPTDSSPIEFTVVFSEEVVGFDETDILLSGSAGATTAVVTDEGEGTYKVKVSGMTGDGTVIASIPVAAAEDGAGNESEASTSTDNEVTYDAQIPPTATPQNLQTNSDIDLPIVLIGTDSDGTIVAYDVTLTGPAHGDLDPMDAQNTTYEPDNGYVGSDSFNFRVQDDDGLWSDPVTVSIDVICPQGSHIDEQTNLCVKDGNGPPPPTPGQCVAVSDAETLADGSPAVLTYVHPNWNHDLEGDDGAAWIWNAALADQSELPETVVFTKTVSLTDAPTGATLQIASDNQYSVEVNDVAVPACDGTAENNFSSIESCAISLNAGANTIEITVTNATPASTSEGNPAGLIFRVVADGADCGEPANEPENSCIDPSSVGAPEAAVPMGTTPGGEDTLQSILDAEYTGDAPDAATEQDNFQEWTATGETIHFEVKNISEDSNSAHNHVFGYYLNGGAFVPVFREGTVGVPHDTVTNLPFGSSLTFSVAGVNSIVFGIADWDGSDYDYYATDRDLNAGTEDHALVYNVNDDVYAIAFEDLSFAAGDEDYNDVVVSLSVEGCEDGAVCEPGVELLKNGGFEAPSVTHGDGWDIFASGASNLDWLVEWFGGSATYNSENRPEVANIELHGGVNGWLPSEGEQYAELDSDWNGHVGSLNGEPGAVTVSQTIDTVPGETYTLTFDFSPRPNKTDAAQNKVEVLVDGTVVYTAGPTAGNGTQTAWTSHSVSFEAENPSTVVAFRDAGTANDSEGTFIDNASLMCEEPEPTATLVATKIVCPTEGSLPNWGAGNVVGEITSTTDEDFLLAHPECHLETWDFQWATDAAGDPEDNGTDPLLAPWATFSGSTEVPVGINLRVREVLKPGYVPFTGQNTDQAVSAEVYCSTDVLHYDNWEWIDGTKEGETYYCVAFNAPTEGGEQCDVDAENVYRSGDADEGGLLTDDESGPASLVETLHESWIDAEDQWIWKDTSTSVEDADVGTEETFTRTFEIVGTPLGASLEIAADNQYVVYINGDELIADLDEDNYSSTETHVIPASMLENGENTLTITVTNIDHETSNDPSNNPAGLLYVLTVNENECEEPQPEFSSVTMCKTDTEGNPLSGWTLALLGGAVDQDLAIPVNSSAGIDSDPLSDGLSYVAFASGLWTNQSGTNPVDAEYSTTDGWVTPMDGYTGYSTDILELQINEAFDPNSDWGAYNSAHLYAQSFVQPSDGPANFRVFDGTGTTPNEGWYGDNGNSTLAVDLYEGYAGITGENGCVVFEDVPYGSYTATEIMKDGWSYYATWDADAVVSVQPDAEVDVDEASETFTIQNRRGGEGDSDTGTLIIRKETVNGDGTFTFNVGGNEMFEVVEITTVEAEGEDELELPVGTYSVTEVGQADWTPGDISCVSEDETVYEHTSITIEEDETVTCTFTNVKDTDFDGGGGGGLAKVYNPGGGDDDGGGEVQGATTCGPLLSTYMRMGYANELLEVTALQNFLNGELGITLPLSGFFGPATDAAVRAFQLKYWEDVLQPWFGIPGSAIQDSDDSTGYVYKTTRWKINDIFCPGSEALPALP